jgi:hypothetical protein
MTPADEATFIARWQQGASYRELAATLGRKQQGYVTLHSQAGVLFQ